MTLSEFKHLKVKVKLKMTFMNLTLTLKLNLDQYMVKMYQDTENKVPTLNEQTNRQTHPNEITTYQHSWLLYL